MGRLESEGVLTDQATLLLAASLGDDGSLRSVAWQPTVTARVVRSGCRFPDLTVPHMVKDR